MDRALLERPAPRRARATGCSCSTPDADEALRLAALTHDMERHFPGGPVIDLGARWRPSEPAYRQRAFGALGADRRRLAARSRAPTAQLVAEVERLIVAHEIGGDPTTRTCSRRPTRSRSSRSTPTLVARWYTSGRCSRERAKAQLTYMFERIRVAAGPRRSREPLYEAGAGRCRREPEWLAPASLDEALALRAERGDEATVVAGGTFVGDPRQPAAARSPRRSSRLRGVPGTRRGRGETASCGSARWSRTAPSSARRRRCEGWPALAHTFSPSSRARACGTRRPSAACSPTPTTPPTRRRCCARCGRAAVARSVRRRARDPGRRADRRPLRDVARARRADRRGARPRRRRTAPSTASSARARTRTGRASASPPRRPATACAWSSGRSPTDRSSSRTLCARGRRARAEIGARATRSDRPDLATSAGRRAYRRRVIAVEVRRALEELA